MPNYGRCWYSLCVVLTCVFAVSRLANADPTVLLAMPEVRQHTDYACGAAALQSILAYYGIDVRQDTLMEKLGTNETRAQSIGK